MLGFYPMPYSCTQKAHDQLGTKFAMPHTATPVKGHMDRTEVIRKLLDTFHLNNDERDVFNDIPLSRVEAAVGIAKILEKFNAYPSTWSSIQDFDGVFLEIKNGKIMGTYKTEVSFGNFQLIETRAFTDPMEAAKFAMEKMLGKEIDGIVFQ